MIKYFFLKYTANCFPVFVQPRLKQHLIKMYLFYPGEHLLRGASIEHKRMRVRESSHSTFGDQKDKFSIINEKAFRIVQQKVFHLLF